LLAGRARAPTFSVKSLSWLLPQRWLRRLLLAPGDLLRDAIYRRLWISIFISSFGGQVTLLALPLTAAVLLHATPTQMGILTAMEVLPFVLFSLPSGVYLDRVRKLPVYVWGEILLALFVASLILLAALAGCATFRGMGEDIENLGKAIKKSTS